MPASDETTVTDRMSATRPAFIAPVEGCEAPVYADDRALIAAVLAGDVRAAGRFHDHLRPVIEHALRRILRGRRDELDDLVQMTFERLVVSLVEERFEGRSNLTTWATAIAMHVALDALRRRLRMERRVVFAFEQDRVPSAGSPEKQMEARSELDRVHDILCRMKPALVEALVLHDVLGHGLDEVAALTHASPSAAQARLFRARKELLRRARASVAVPSGAVGGGS